MMGSVEPEVTDGTIVDRSHGHRGERAIKHLVPLQHAAGRERGGPPPEQALAKVSCRAAQSRVSLAAFRWARARARVDHCTQPDGNCRALG
jgi:hypothetical protein